MSDTKQINKEVKSKNYLTGEIENVYIGLHELKNFERTINSYKGDYGFGFTLKFRDPYYNEPFHSIKFKEEIDRDACLAELLSGTGWMHDLLYELRKYEEPL